ncbi:MAG TPA: hypothetical protein VJA64_03970 [Desulfobaccales bacterium]|nr:hypothetical protein [Desulfobaccales bacterium]
MMPMRLKTRLSLKIMLTALGVLGFLIPEAALATTQFSDILYLNGQKHSLDSLPLESHYGPGNPRPKFRAPNTATWRGYIATWEIDRGVLYLKSIQAWTEQGKVGLEALFPAQKGPVPATWFTGKLTVPQGKILKPAVPHPIYGKYLLITVKKGRVVNQEVMDNPGETRSPGP